MQTGGTVYVWGCNTRGELGVGDYDNRRTPCRLDTLPYGKRAVVVACGRNHTAALLSTGELFTWGSNQYGQLGVGDTEMKNLPCHVPLPVEPTTGKLITQLACGGWFTAVVLGSELYSWGSNSFGQLAIPERTFKSSPCRTVLPAGTRVRSVACGTHHTLSITDGGDLFAWGRSNYGQVGGSCISDPVTVPQHVPQLKGVTAVACGNSHSAALSQGAVYTWGKNNYGQLGVGDTRPHSEPTRVTALPQGAQITSIACGSYHTAVCTANGELFTWGHNTFGQLGSANRVSKSLPHRVTLVYPASSVVCGAGHTVALCTNGKLLWGLNSRQQLGLGDTVDRLTPCPMGEGLPRDSCVVSAACGLGHTVVIV
eukprot:TRINITY_DN5509_c0_g1_i1.p1 TRINITY_DN5509_c0_g1~~TRINITY_DN5509_c0_g1_i1.p1  ORF type:complete len:369 (+),score=30.27 TRINITY_DN5509_c0_g1_i1:247-1353(+)